MIQNIPTIPPHMQLEEPQTRVSARSSIWFSVAFVLLEALLAIGSLVLASSSWFVEHTDAFSGYGHQPTLNCDIVLYGDSTALSGLNAKVIQGKTGLKTCNIAEIRPVGDFVGPYVPLDDYLAHNKTPAYLVAAWTASDFRINRAPRMQNDVEGFEYALRYDRGPWLWKSMLREPGAALKMMAYEQFAVINAPLHVWYQARISHRNNRIRRAEGQGWMPYLQPSETACLNQTTKYVFSTFEENATAVKEFRKRYEARGIKVLVDVMPEADCTLRKQEDVAVVRGLHDNAFEMLPVGLFNVEDDHLTAEGSVGFSNEVANQVLALMKQDHRDTP